MKKDLLRSANDFFREIGLHMRDAQILLVASSLAYTTILSIVPLLAMSFAVFQAFGGLDKLYGVIEPFVLANLAEAQGGQAVQTIRTFIGKIHAGALGAGGFVGLIFTCMSMLFSVEKAINQVWKTSNSRPFFTRLTTYWFFITLGPLALAFALGAATSSTIPTPRLLPSGIGIYLITVALFFGAYKWIPNRPVHWLPALLSAFVTSGIWNLARIGYSFYTRQLVSYGKIYGSLAAIPILLLWIYVVWVVVLTGAALTATMQKRLENR